MSKSQTNKMIGNPSGRGFWKSRVPGNYSGLILDGRTIEVPVNPPHCEEGQVTTEYAFWSTLQAEQRGFRLGFIIGLSFASAFIIIYLLR